MQRSSLFIIFTSLSFGSGIARDEEKIMKAFPNIRMNRRNEEAPIVHYRRYIVLDPKSIKFKAAKPREKACYWANEVYEPCFGGCAEISCDNPRSHMRPCYPYCEPGCVCEEPYVRDDRTHQCVLPHDCSPTQLGIPIPRKHHTNPPPSKQPKKIGRTFSNIKDDAQQIYDNEPSIASSESRREKIIRGQEGSRTGSDVTRLGNYFNIVIAPPPIKALQPRKIIPHDNFVALSNKY